MSEVIKHNAKLWERRSESRSFFLFWCPGCERGHTYESPRWTFDGNHERPSFAPSLRLFTPAGEHGPEKTVCHLHVTNGEIHYCGDCDHKLNGHTGIAMVDIPDDYGF